MTDYAVVDDVVSGRLRLGIERPAGERREPSTPFMCGLGFHIARLAIEAQEKMDDEGCGPVFAAMRWPSPPVNRE